MVGFLASSSEKTNTHFLSENMRRSNAFRLVRNSFPSVKFILCCPVICQELQINRSDHRVATYFLKNRISFKKQKINKLNYLSLIIELTKVLNISSKFWHVARETRKVHITGIKSLSLSLCLAYIHIIYLYCTGLTNCSSSTRAGI